MAVYTTLFVLSGSEFSEYFPNARRALSEPILRSIANPFTGESKSVPTWDPGSEISPTSLQDTRGREILPASELPETNYARGLEGGAAPLTRTFPHLAWKNIDFLELSLAVLGDDCHEDFFVDCPDEEGCLSVLPSRATQQLAEADQANLNTIANEWKNDPNVGWKLEERLFALQGLQHLAGIAIEVDGYLVCHSLA